MKKKIKKIPMLIRQMILMTAILGNNPLKLPTLSLQG